MSKQIINVPNGPEAKGPYSLAVAYRNLVFVSGQGPVDPGSGKIVLGTVAEQTQLALANVRTILEAAGSGMNNALKVTLYLADMNDFQEVNDIYKEHFGPQFPARTTIQAGRLPFDIKVEIDVVAYVDGGV